MNTSYDTELEFGKFEVTDMRFSRLFQSEDKDRLRIPFTTGNIAVLMSDKISNYPKVVANAPEGIQGEEDKKSFWDRVWAWIKDLVKGILNGVGMGALNVNQRLN